MEPRYVMRPEDYREINQTRTSFWEKVKGFFMHVYYMSLAKPSPQRDRYRSAFRQYETLDRKAKLRQGGKP